jgi:hypothetical protein
MGCLTSDTDSTRRSSLRGANAMDLSPSKTAVGASVNGVADMSIALVSSIPESRSSSKQSSLVVFVSSVQITGY